MGECCIKYSVCILSSHNEDALNLPKTLAFIISLDQPNNPVGSGMGEKTGGQRKAESKLELPLLEHLLGVHVHSQKMPSFKGSCHISLL